MKHRQSSRRSKAARQIEMAVGIWLAVWMWGSAASAAGVPGWLREAASASLPRYPAETTAVVLLDEQEAIVSESGEVRLVHRRACRILRPEGRREGEVDVFFGRETRIANLNAWCITAQGIEHEAKEKDAAETGLTSYALYSDRRHKVLEVPGADPGSVVGYECELRDRPFVLQNAWFFQEDIPVRLARYTLQLPPGWEYKATWVNRPPQDPEPIGAGRWVWKVENVPGIEPEPSMPPWRALAGWLGISYLAQGPAREKSINSWSQLGKWESKLAEGRRQSNPEMQEKVKQLTTTLPTLREKIQALAAFVQRDIRYVAVEIGIGGYQPHPASDVFTNRYGDCKDKATLLSAMLHEIGVESYYVDVHSQRGVVAPQFPSEVNFNHVILAIRLPQDLPTNNLHSLYSHPTLGPLLFFDPTSQLVPLGDLPYQEQGGNGLLVTADGGELVELPMVAPAFNRLLRVAKMELTPTGTVQAGVQEIRWGANAAFLRSQLRDTPETDRRKFLENLVGDFVGDSFVQSPQLEGLDSIDAPLIMSYHFVAGNYAKSVGNLLLVRPRILGEKSRGLLEGKERKYPVEFWGTSLESDLCEFTLPDGYEVDELPPPTEVSCAAAEYKSKVEVTGRTLRYVRSYTVKQLRVPTDHLAELKSFYRRIAADEQAMVVLKRSGS